MKNFKYTCLILLFALPGISPAAMMSYNLDLTHNPGLSNGIDYGTVTITDGILPNPGDDAYVRFDITLNLANFILPEKPDNFGIDEFFFNSELDLTAPPGVTIVLGEPSWQLGTSVDGFTAAAFGKFDAQYKRLARGDRVSPQLSFLLDVPGDSLMNYALDNSQGFAFALHVGGFGADGEDSGWLSTSLSPVPLPAAFWLFGTALIGLTGFSKGKAQA